MTGNREWAWGSVQYMGRDATKGTLRRENQN